jgi:hypothetical protein
MKTMKKRFFNWMLALSLVATPMVFTSCGDDDDDTIAPPKTEDQGIQSFSVSLRIWEDGENGEPLEDFKQAKKTVQTAMYQAIYDATGMEYSILLILISEEQFSRMLKSLDATYEKLKDTNMYDGFYRFNISRDGVKVREYIFGKYYDVTLLTDTISFENQALNNEKFWIGDAEGKYTYTEKGLTVTGTQSLWNGKTYWSGFAISGRTENTFTNLTPDQYNTVLGGTQYGEKFLVVQNAYKDYECITFEKPVKVKSMRCINSAYSYNSMVNGDSIAGEAFAREDWFSGYIICLGETGDTLSTTEVCLAYKNSMNSKYIDYWHTASVNTGHVKTIKFAFDGSRKNSMGLLTPAYMCVDRIIVRRYE